MTHDYVHVSPTHHRHPRLSMRAFCLYASEAVSYEYMWVKDPPNHESAHNSYTNEDASSICEDSGQWLGGNQHPPAPFHFTTYPPSPSPSPCLEKLGPGAGDVLGRPLHDALPLQPLVVGQLELRLHLHALALRLPTHTRHLCFGHGKVELVSERPETGSSSR